MFDPYIKYHSSFFIDDILRRITALYERHSVFFVMVQSDVTSKIGIKSSDVTFNVACELSQPMGKK